MSNKSQGNNNEQGSSPSNTPVSQPNKPEAPRPLNESVDFGESNSSTTVNFNPAPPPPPRPPKGN